LARDKHHSFLMDCRLSLEDKGVPVGSGYIGFPDSGQAALSPATSVPATTFTNLIQPRLGAGVCVFGGRHSRSALQALEGVACLAEIWEKPSHSLRWMSFGRHPIYLFRPMLKGTRCPPAHPQRGSVRFTMDEHSRAVVQARGDACLLGWWKIGEDQPRCRCHVDAH
jgi:hypothetical protein